MADKKLTELVEISTPVLATDLMYIVRPSLGTDGSKFVPVSNLPTAAHTHVFGDIPGLQTALDGKLATGGTAADVSPTGASIAAALAGKAASSHSHAISGVTGLQDALDAKLATNATAVDVNPAGSSIAAALATKALSSHTHPATQISDSTATGRSVLTAADAPAARTAIGAGTSSFSGAYADLSGRPTLGDAAGKNTGTGASEVAAGNHLHPGLYESVQTAASQAEAEAGTEAGIRSFSPLRIKQAITALGGGGGGGSGGAPVSAEYLVKTADGTLTAERVVGDSTSVAANWTTAGQVTFTRAALTGDVAAAANSNATTIAAGAVNTSKLGGDITTAGKALLDDADAAAQRTTLGLGSLSTQSGTFSGTSSGVNTGDQTIALTGDVTGSGTGSFAATIANGAVSTGKLGGDITTAGKALLDDADAAAQRTTLGLGTLATQSGAFSGTSSGTNTGDQTIALTGDVTGSGTGSFAASIAADAVTNAKLANVATGTLKGRATAGTGDPEDLTGTQATALLGTFTSAAKGLAPASGGGTANFLRADGTWASPPSGGGGISDGNKGDITVSGSGATWTLNAALSGKSFTDPTIVGTIIEDIHTITDGAAFEVDPANGSIQLVTLGASRTPKATNFAAGESVTLMVDDGTAYALTWTDATWGTGGVKWVGGSAPTLATTGYTVLQFWEVGTQVYGARVGEVA